MLSQNFFIKLGRRTKLTYPDDPYVTYHYDAMSQLTDVDDSGESVLPHYGYDNVEYL
jgi:hypothetical protein